MEGFVAVTDPAWYERLSRTLGSKDANFWRPSARSFQLAIGTPFLFKLKAPHDAIAGYGYFAGFTILPDWLAWDTFGEANGVDSLAALQARIARIQRGARIHADPGRRIGCCLIAEARFFPNGTWVRTPLDWSPRTQTGASYDLSHGEGQRVWAECLERSASSVRADTLVVHEPIARYGTPTLHVPRLGQAIFRVKVLDAYTRACAVTGEHSLPALEAAHIRAYRRGGEHAVSNGVSFRADIHRLFDRGYVTVDEEQRFVVSRRLKDEFENGRSYYQFHGQVLAVPQDVSMHPSREALEWHRTQTFLG